MPWRQGIHLTQKDVVGGTCGTHGGGEKCLVGRPEGKRPLGRHSRRWEDNIKTALRE